MRTGISFAFMLSIAAAGYAAQPWNTKPFSEWTDKDAREILSDSPWSKPVTPMYDRSGDAGVGRAVPGGLGEVHGSVGGTIGTGVRGTDAQVSGPLGRRNGQDDDRDIGAGREPGGNIPVLPVVTVRWESALPVRHAEQKLGEEPLGADELQYAVSIAGLPAFSLNGDPGQLKTRMQSDAYLKKGKKKIAPVDVKVVMRDGNPILLLLFPRTEEITFADKELEVSVRARDLEIKQKFTLKPMTLNGKLEL
jgi:hypothetical protein